MTTIAKPRHNPPVMFNYESGDTVLRNGSQRAIAAKALSVGETSFAAMLGFVALLFGAVAPWAILGLEFLDFPAYPPAENGAAPDQG
ncbi:MAG: hypothetical protein IPP45_14785 [Sphingomonadales bacterium]|nr:hypothetical protein [Sphingomonadales bacterium]